MDALKRMEKIIRENVFQQKKKKLELIGLALIGPSNNLAPTQNPTQRTIPILDPPLESCLAEGG